MINYKETMRAWEKHRKKLIRNGEGYFLEFLVNRIHKALIEKSDKYREAIERTPLDYISASPLNHGTYEDLYEEEVLEGHRLILLSEVSYGGSEGVYADIFCYKDDRLSNPVTIKTLNSSSETIGDMGLITSMLIEQLREFIYTDIDEKEKKEKVEGMTRIASCTGQYIGTGVEIEVMLFEDSDGYTMQIAPTCNAYAWVEENPDAEEPLVETENDCERFGIRKVHSLETINSIVEKWLSDGQHFYEDEYGISSC